MTINTREFEFVRGLVFKRIANTLAPSKRALVKTRLSSTARELGFASASALVEHAREAPKGKSSQAIVDAMTTNETLFFRDTHPFELMRTTLIPKLIEARQRYKTLRIWSAACATGQEPYTISLLLERYFPLLVRDWKIELVATDVSREALKHAREGLFSDRELRRGLPSELRQRYFRKTGSQWQLDEKVRKRVRFHRHNLVTDRPPQRGSDIVLLRNVLIYFDEETKRRVLAKVASSMRRDGALFLGASEDATRMSDLFVTQRSGPSRYFILR